MVPLHRRLRTVEGLRTARGNPIYVINAENFSKLGSGILKTFKDCKEGIPHPNFKEKQPKDEILKATGVKTDKALMTAGKIVSVYLNENQVEIKPWYFDGKHLQSPTDREIYCSLDPDDITKTVLAAFEKCRA